MSTKGETSAQGPQPHGLDPAILAIPLNHDLDFNTHNTSGEHAMKESGTWNEFLHCLKDEQGGEPTGRDGKDAYYYYLFDGPGRFYRAYDHRGGGPLLAGFTITPNEQQGFMVDHSYSIAEASVAASAYHRMLTHKFFDTYCGMPPLPRTSNLTIPVETLEREPGFARAVYDFGLVNVRDFVIPMPGVAPVAFEDITDEKKEAVREAIRTNAVTGVLPYVDMDGEKYTTAEEFYRSGEFVGTLIEESVPEEPGSYRRIDTLAGQTANGEVIEFEADDLRNHTAQKVRFLKTLAEQDSQLAKLILG